MDSGRSGWAEQGLPERQRRACLPQAWTQGREAAICLIPPPRISSSAFSLEIVPKSLILLIFLPTFIDPVRYYRQEIPDLLRPSFAEGKPRVGLPASRQARAAGQAYPVE